jgi:hypothetical protein
MATSKAKRPVLLAQPKPQHAKYARAGGPGSQRRSPNPKTNPEATELMPVKSHAYRAIAELNGGFEKVVRDLQTVGEISYFRSDRVRAMYNLICRIRAQANRDFIMALYDREMANAGHFERLCIQWEKEAGER